VSGDRLLPRHEDARLVTGRGTFLDDVPVIDPLHAAFVRSTRARARVTDVDPRGADGRPGIAGVYWAATLPGPLSPLPDAVSPSTVHPYLRTFTSPPQAPLARDVHHVGEPVAVVLGRDRYVVADAVEAVEVAYEERPAVPTIDDALAMRGGPVHAGAASNVAGLLQAEVGDVEAAFRRAAVVVAERFHVQRVQGLPLETRGIVVEPDRRAGGLTVHAAHQNPYRLRDGIARCLGLPTERIRVIAPDVGGGFGSKGMVYPEDIVCCLLAYRLGRAVKWVETRSESFLGTNQAREMRIDARLAADADGRILGLDVKIDQDSGAYCHYEMVLPSSVLAHLPGLYRVPAVRAQASAVLTTKVQASPYRGAGRPEAAFAIERLLDLLSRELGLDPAETRRRNLVTPGDLPYRGGLRMPNGVPVEYDSGDFPLMLGTALELVEYPRWRALQREASGRRLGIGLAGCVEGGGFGPCEGARVRVDPGGEVTVDLGVGSQGQSHETVFARLCADFLGVSAERVRVRGGDTALFPYGFGTRASRVAVNTGNAVALAAATVRERACQLAARALECSAEDIVLADGAASVRGFPGRAVLLGDLAMAALQAPDPSAPVPGLEATSFYHPPGFTWAGSVSAAVVEVDPETGRVDVLRYVTVHDCGRPLDARVVEGQAAGGIAQGLGAALSEELVYDAAGQLTTGTLMDYAPVRAADMPSLVLQAMDFPATSNPLGVKGIGEGSTAGPPAAIAGAIDDALGGKARVTRAPFTAERVWRWAQALDERS
jgi:carbon-monoxide dehydrogenase large subunit